MLRLSLCEKAREGCLWLFAVDKAPCLDMPDAYLSLRRISVSQEGFLHAHCVV